MATEKISPPSCVAFVQRAIELSIRLVTITETRVVARNDQAARAIGFVVEVRRKAHVAYKEFGREPAEKNKEHDRSYYEKEELT